MSDVKRYIQKRAESDMEFAQNYEAGYADFKIGVILRQARESAGLTQEELARRLKTKNLLFHALRIMLMMCVFQHYGAMLMQLALISKFD